MVEASAGLPCTLWGCSSASLCHQAPVSPTSQPHCPGGSRSATPGVDMSVWKKITLKYVNWRSQKKSHTYVKHSRRLIDRLERQWPPWRDGIYGPGDELSWVILSPPNSHLLPTSACGLPSSWLLGKSFRNVQTDPLDFTNLKAKNAVRWRLRL